MKKLSSYILVILIVMLATGCTVTANTVVTPLYHGKSLSVGVVGEAPKVREEHVSFTSISFEELEEYAKLSADYDAVFIMKEHLSEAAENKYAKVYKKAGIPFYFIGSTKSFMPFVTEKLSYEDISDTHSGMYITGYLQTGETYKTWGYGLYKDIVNEPNIKDAYSRVFTTIASIENGTVIE
ncbi:hypothetical protein [Paenibacillus sp. FSL L8-0494]|uniref:hypothetical protein n=1 Tax=Paenibacillus sp. FSL L8-0494 TaxID=2975352 RepID=UPI0030FB07B9